MPDRIFQLLSDKGSRLYGEEAVTQLEHALQCAALAQANGANDELITAALLHDLGHLMRDVSVQGEDDRHQYRALHLLRRRFGPAVLEPIRLHVDAKRYLCAMKPGYMEKLSPASIHSLELQGGVFSAHQTRRFVCQPYWRDAVRLREWDDEAKVLDARTPPLDHFASIAARLSPR